VFYIVSYDITDTSRRTRLAKSLEDFGDRVQYSVFECILDNELFEIMISKIEKIVIEKEDSVRIYPLCANCEKVIRIIGKGIISKNEDFYII
jgi:CRISPR-associated protein Cas2